MIPVVVDILGPSYELHFLHLARLHVARSTLADELAALGECLATYRRDGHAHAAGIVDEGTAGRARRDVALALAVVVQPDASPEEEEERASDDDVIFPVHVSLRGGRPGRAAGALRPGWLGLGSRLEQRHLLREE